MLSGIYLIKNFITNEIYIGSSKNIKKRLYQHKFMLRRNIHSNKKLQNSWNKYNEVSFTFEIIDLIEIEKLTKTEQFYLDKLNPEYNIRKIAENNYGYKMSEESKLKMSMSQKGKSKSPMTSETKKKISDSQKGKKKNFKPEYIDFLRTEGPLVGIKHTEYHKSNISKSLKGKKHSKERIENRKKNMKGINSIISEEDVMKIKEMIRDGYKNIDISKLFGLKPGRISDIRRGKTFSWVII